MVLKSWLKIVLIIGNIEAKKGAFLYQLDAERYAKDFNAFLNFIPNPDMME